MIMVASSKLIISVDILEIHVDLHCILNANKTDMLLINQLAVSIKLLIIIFISAYMYFFVQQASLIGQMTNYKRDNGP